MKSISKLNLENSKTKHLATSICKYLLSTKTNILPFTNQHSSDLIKFPLLKSPYFHPHLSQFIKHLSFMNLESDTLLQIKNWWMPLFLTSDNIFQQTRSDNHKNYSKQNITTSLHFSPNRYTS